MKRILDTVHGYIYIDDDLMSSFVDTLYFQRLRRIEQTSARAVFPSARHDRFIHSLGVYAIGRRIVDSIKANKDDFGYKEAVHEPFFKSYLIACLMHDCAHTPFSHTFEGYFKGSEEELAILLKNELEDSESFEIDRFDDNKEEFKIAPHEYLSAILCLKKYKKEVVQYGAIPDLVARMIVGIQYKQNHSFENCLISLIHGDVIDADRLDYVCRDRWASGYSTSTIDVARLIASIHIIKKDGEQYRVCYDSSAIHDIEGVLAVKEFQQKFVINHHTICYEQFLLKKAMGHTANCLINEDCSSENEETATLALKSLCNPPVMWDGLHAYGFDIDYLSDDDFVNMMKRFMDNTYVNQWFSRNYAMKPLWKSKADFYSLFSSKKNDPLDEYNSVYRKSDPYNLEREFRGELKVEDFLRLNAEEKVSCISNNMFILTKNGSFQSHESLFGHQESKSSVLFFYLYLSSDAMRYKDRIIKYLNA